MRLLSYFLAVVSMGLWYVSFTENNLPSGVLALLITLVVIDLAWFDIKEFWANEP